MKTSQLLFKKQNNFTYFFYFFWHNRCVKYIKLKPLIKIGILPFLLCKSADIETNSFAWSKLHSPKSNPKLKYITSYLTASLLCEEFARGVHSQCCYTLLPISMIKIKEVQIGDHEIKMLHFSDESTIFLRDITCLKAIQVILKLYKDASSLKINFWKVKRYGLEHIKIELTRKMVKMFYWNTWSQFW